MKKIVISSILAGLLATTSLEAFDEQREGFIVSFGAGVSSINTEIDFSRYGADDTSFGLATSFKIGYGFTNQFLLYYINDISWYGYDNDPNDDTYTSGLTGIGASYYIQENSPFYVMGGVGIGSFTNFSESEGETGSAFIIGGGYEVSPHIQVEATYLSTSVKEDSIDLDTGAFRLTANYIWY
jgi:hypothetical protein